MYGGPTKLVKVLMYVRTKAVFTKSVKKLNCLDNLIYITTKFIIICEYHFYL